MLAGKSAKTSSIVGFDGANEPAEERTGERTLAKEKKNYIVRNYFLSIVSQEFWYAEGKLRSKVRRPIERKVEKREGTERRVCVYFIYMVEATERCGTYLLIPVKRELVACQSTKGGNRKGGRVGQRKRERMKDSSEVFGRRAEVNTIVDP